MKILLISQYYFPDDFRVNEISRMLAKRGHQVEVLTGLPDYTTGRVPGEYRFFRKRTEMLQGIRVIRVPVIARRTGAVWRALNYLSFMLNSTLKCIRLPKDYDIICCYQTSPVTMANAALRMKKKSKKPLFLYCLDLWPESLKAWKVKEKSVLYRLIHKYSRHIYQNCDLIGISSDTFRTYLSGVNGVDEEKITYLPQHCTDWFSDISGQYCDKDTVDFVFAGNIGSVQDVACIIKAASHLKDEPNIFIHILGDGSELNYNKMLANELGVEDKVLFYGRLAHEKLRQYYLAADAFLLTLKNESFIGSTVPAKLQEYMSLGKPVIAAVEGAAKQIIEQADCGFVTKPSDERALAKAIKKYAQNPDLFHYKGANARNFYCSYFTADVFIDKLDNIIGKLS